MRRGEGIGVEVLSIKFQLPAQIHFHYLNTPIIFNYTCQASHLDQAQTLRSLSLLLLVTREHDKSSTLNKRRLCTNYILAQRL